MTAIRATGAATKRAKTPAEEDWRIKREALKKNQVRSITPKDAKRLQDEQGYVLLDVRPQNEFQKMHPIGAVNVEIYRLIKEWTAWDIARRLGFAFFGIFDDVRAKVESKSKVIVACASGGTMKPTPTLADGQQSRSLIAAYVLLMDGYTNVLHLEGKVVDFFNRNIKVVLPDTQVRKKKVLQDLPLQETKRGDVWGQHGVLVPETFCTAQRAIDNVEFLGKNISRNFLSKTSSLCLTSIRNGPLDGHAHGPVFVWVITHTKLKILQTGQATQPLCALV
ncbi:hypothetical protein SELMODRAFT_417511 [Selaginella moellendorffii]|uniref:Rhodanese domain-containing protein n=1 Tax=Selaginella moellendorffii TaxID=88036 RepID=D8S2G9_SELML|nr:hypothetical protein SELMODRAFT_417511 [Selaginella moellendorffii]